MKMMEFNVAVRPDPVEEKTKGGLILASQTQEHQKHAGQRGTLSHVSPMAFNADIWPAGEPKPQAGDRVVFARHAGMFLEEEGVEYRVMKDKDIVAVIDG